MGRRWNIDPITYAWHSPYSCFYNNPVFFNDPAGLAPPKWWNWLTGKAYKNKAYDFADKKGVKRDDIQYGKSSKTGQKYAAVITGTEDSDGRATVTGNTFWDGGTKLDGKESTRRDDRRDGNRRRDWRGGNYARGWNASPFDEKGREILGRWLNGSGNPLYVQNGDWGEYMKKNDLLTSQINGILNTDAASRTSSGIFAYLGSAEIQNGYLTGYEMLHGTHSGVGGFRITGFATVIDANTVEYSLKLSWHDIIDPNPTYGDDVTLSDLLNKFYSPKDYEIHIYWDIKTKVRK